MQFSPDGYLDLWFREGFKDLADDTPMLTANRGWTTHGELLIGDRVFSPSGTQVKVVALSERYKTSKCYEIEFQHGEKIVTGSGHLWKIRKRHKPRIRGTNKRDRVFSEEIITTEEMARRGGRLDIGRADALKYHEQSLPVDPYVLGAWLGDGHSAGARFTCSDKDSEIIDHLKLKISIQKKSTTSGTSLYSMGEGIRGKKGLGLTYELRKLGVLNHKHIPPEYMKASAAQRLDLLRGLMDTDGSCDMRGKAVFCQKSKILADQVYDLVAGLGMKPSVNLCKSKFNGEPYEFYQVRFIPNQSTNPFMLKRKAARVKIKSHYDGNRIVKKIIPIASVPTRCIQVEGGMYLAGRELLPTHNSTIITIALTIQNILNDPEITVGIFSHTKPIAKSFLRVIKREFESNEILKELFPDILYKDPAAESPKWSEDGGILVKRSSNPPEATVEANGLVDGAPTGRHYKLRTYDDVITCESVSTTDQMRKVLDALDMSHNLGQRGGSMRMIGTRYKLGDAYEEYINRGIVKPRIYPATDDGTTTGNPVFHSKEEWEKKLQEMSPAIIASQMLQNPMASDSVIFQPDWIRIWPSDKELPTFDAVFLSIDGAFSVKQTADDSCLLMLGLFKATEGTPKYSVMVLDCYMEKSAYPDLRDEVLMQWGNKYGKSDKTVDGCIIEDKASGSALIPDLKRGGIAVYPYDPGQLDKIARANLVSHLVRDGYLWIPESRNPKRKGMPMSWLAKAYDQWLYFPNSKNDDAVDALVQALAVLDKNGFLRGRVAPTRHTTYYNKINVGSYS